MMKVINPRPDWLKASHVLDVYSLSGCVSPNFADYINYWKHNGWWLFNSPEIISNIVKSENIKVTKGRYFYYEVYEKEYNIDTKTWADFKSEDSFETEVIVPAIKHLEGYDVVNFTVRTSPECSALSCNGVAEKVVVNQHCLLNTFDEAVQHLESGKFDKAEPGPYRIFSVYSL